MPSISIIISIRVLVYPSMFSIILSPNFLLPQSCVRFFFFGRFVHNADSHLSAPPKYSGTKDIIRLQSALFCMTVSLPFG